MGHDIRFEEIVKVMKEYGYEIKQPKGGSSHYSFVKSGCNRIVIPRHKPIKKVEIPATDQSFVISTRPLRQYYDTENYQRLQPDFE